MWSLIMLTAFSVAPGETEIAFKDRGDNPYRVYFTLSDSPEEEKELLEKVLKVVVPSLSHKQHLPSQLPVRIEGTELIRIDLQALGWENQWVRVLRTHYPYRPDLTKNGQYPLVVSARWFVTKITDPVETPGALELLIYGKVPKNLNEVLSFWGVQSDIKHFWGFVEGNSGVAENRARTFENRPTTRRVDAWVAKDFANFSKETDPIENLRPGSVKFDASEGVIGIPKAALGEMMLLNAYFLANGNGQLQNEAPIGIVSDKLRVRSSAVRNWISCIGCHSEGVVDPTLNDYADFLVKGGEIDADYKSKEEIRNYLEVDIQGRLDEHKKLYAKGIFYCSGMMPQEFSAGYMLLVSSYDQPLTLKDCAREIGATSEELKLALGNATNKGYIKNEGRIASIAQNKPIPRERWEQLAYEALAYTVEWRKTQ